MYSKVLPKYQLKELYINQKLSSTEIGGRFGVAHSTIVLHLKNVGVCVKTNQVILPKHQLFELYINQKLSSREIARRFNSNQASVLDYLKIYNIPSRKKGFNFGSEQLKHWWADGTFTGIKGKKKPNSPSFIEKIKQAHANGAYDKAYDKMRGVKRPQTSKILKQMYADGKLRRIKRQGFTHSEQTRKRIGDAHRGRINLKLRGKNNPLYGKVPKSCGLGKSGFREDLQCFFRSRWEANFARILNYVGWKWRYEPITVEMVINKSQTTYTPDFLINKRTYIEVKGYMKKDSEAKIKEFKKNHELILLDFLWYKMLARSYSSIIPNWEYSKGRVY